MIYLNLNEKSQCGKDMVQNYLNYLKICKNNYNVNKINLCIGIQFMILHERFFYKKYINKFDITEIRK